VGFVLGPAVGALVTTTFGQRPVFLIMVAASIVAAAAAWSTRIEEEPREHERSNAWRDFTSGLRLAYGTRSLRYYILMGTAVWFGFGAFSALEPLFYRDVVGVGVEWIGWMNALYGAGLITGAMVLPRLPAGILSARGLAVVTVVTGLGTVLYVGSTDLRLIGAGGLVWGVVIGAFEPLLRTLLHLDSPHAYVGRIIGTSQWHKSAGELLPLAFVPALAAAVGIQETLIGGGLLVAAIALAGIAEAAAVDRLKRVSGPKTASEVAAVAERA
jgi:predicted MFS family arabinose efflux permease